MRATASLLFAATLLSLPAIADDKADVEARAAAFAEAYNAGDAAGVAAFYTDDALILPPEGDIVSGGDGIEALWQGAMDAGMADFALTPVDVMVAGDAAYDSGTYTATMGEAQASGKYLVVWTKGDDGTWMILRDTWNSAPAE